MDERFQHLMQQLGEAVNDAVMGSKEVDDALAKVRDSGIDVFLVLEATICVRRKDGEPIDVADEPAIPVESEDVDLSDEDMRFLKRLRISVE